MTLTSLEDIFDYVCTDADFTFLNSYFTSAQIVGVQNYLVDNRAAILDITNWDTQMVQKGYTEALNIIKHYAYAVSQTTTPFDMEQYTSDFMELVESAYTNELISLESALMINGTISTLYCSRTAWNYIQPDPYQCTRYILHGANMWYLADCQDDVVTILGNDNTIDFVGYPYIENSVVKRIYVYANLSYNLALTDFEEVMSTLNDGNYTNTVDEGTDGTNNYTLSLGSHHVLSATGYADYVYIDFEQ